MGIEDRSQAVAPESGGSDLYSWAGRIAVICLASLVVLIEAARECDTANNCTGYRGWAVACSTISLALTLVLLLGWKFGALSSPAPPIPQGEFITALFFFALWSAGAGTMTTKEPFEFVGNGYFGTWVCFFVSAGLAIRRTPQFQSAMSALASAGDDIAMIFCASAVLVLQASIDCNNCTGKLAYAIAVGAISLVASFCGIFFRQMIPPTPFAVFMCLWWATAWFVITFFGPYKGIGNGYFAVSAGFFYSVKTVLTIFDLVRYIEQADLGHTSGGGGGGGSAPPPKTESSSLVPPSAPAADKYEAIGGQTEC